MENNRRKFIVSGGLVAAGIAAGGFKALVSGGRSPEGDVAAVIANYGESLRITRDGAKATQYRVKMHGIGKFVKTFDPAQLPFERIQVSAGNTLKFNHRGIDFTLVNVA